MMQEGDHDNQALPKIRQSAISGNMPPKVNSSSLPPLNHKDMSLVE
jgi:hypothetical protein